MSGAHADIGYFRHHLRRFDQGLDHLHGLHGRRPQHRSPAARSYWAPRPSTITAASSSYPQAPSPAPAGAPVVSGGTQTLGSASTYSGSTFAVQRAAACWRCPPIQQQGRRLGGTCPGQWRHLALQWRRFTTSHATLCSPAQAVASTSMATATPSRRHRSRAANLTVADEQHRQRRCADHLGRRYLCRQHRNHRGHPAGWAPPMPCRSAPVSCCRAARSISTASTRRCPA